MNRLRRRHERNNSAQPDTGVIGIYRPIAWMGVLMSIIRRLLQRRMAKISDTPHSMQALIDADNHGYPAAYQEPRDCYRRLSEVPNNK